MRKNITIVVNLTCTSEVKIINNIEVIIESQIIALQGSKNADMNLNIQIETISLDPRWI